MSRILVVAPHPDDETLGCGGTLLRHRSAGDEIHWLIVTCPDASVGFDETRIEMRKTEIQRVAAAYGMSSVQEANFPAAMLDAIPLREVVGKIAGLVEAVGPEVVYLPYRGDVHSDHRVVFDATMATTKWFRYPTIKRVVVYETLSETEFGLRPGDPAFRPNIFVDVSSHMERKIEIMRIYGSEMGPFPFPRSEEAMRALAAYRGAACGFQAAEAFVLLKETVG